MNPGSQPPNEDRLRPAPGGAFPATHWSVVLNAGVDTASRAHEALETLCARYWYPLYAYIRRQGRPHHDAEDCTQAFLAHLIANAGMARARPERGRFRTFLVSALRHFLANEWHRSQAAKRGSGQAVLSLDFERGDERYARDPADPGLTPEQALDRSWALELLDQATGALREDYEKSGRGPLFAALAPMLWGNGTEESVAASAARLGMTADAFSVALYRMRRRFGERLRAIVADTVAAPEDLDAELRHLIDAVGGSAHDP